MTTTILCPSCSTASTILRRPIGPCPSCGTQFPPALMLEAERALARERHQRPLLLTMGLWFSGFFGVIMLVLICLAPFDIGHYSINAQAVSGPDFLRRLGILWVAIGVTYVIIAVGLYQERPWTRLVILWWWLLLLATGTVADWQDGISPIPVVVTTLVCVGVAAWYLYARENVAEYYRYLAASSDQGPNPVA